MQTAATVATATTFAPATTPSTVATATTVAPAPTSPTVAPATAATSGKSAETVQLPAERVQEPSRCRAYCRQEHRPAG